MIFRKNKKQEEPKPLTQYVFDEEAAEKCKQVLMGKMYAEYVGGTLSFKINFMREDGFNGDMLILASMRDAEWSDKTRFYISLCYMKYKGDVNKELFDKSLENCYYNTHEAIGSVFKFFEISD